MYSMHTSATCEWLQCRLMFSLPNVTQLHPPSAHSQTSYQEFSGCLSGSGSWSKLMAEQQSSLQCETYPPIYHTDCRHDVVAGECAATHPTYVSTFLFSSFPSFFPLLFFLFLLSSCLPLSDYLSFLSFTPTTHPVISLPLTLSSSCPCELPFSTLQKKTHTQFAKNARCKLHVIRLTFDSTFTFSWHRSPDWPIVDADYIPRTIKAVAFKGQT